MPTEIPMAQKGKRENAILIIIIYNRQTTGFEMDKVIHEKTHKARFHTLPIGF